MLSLPACLFFMKSIISQPLEDNFLLFPLFLWGIEIALGPNGLGLTFKTFPSCFPLDTVSAVWFSPPISFIWEGLAHIQRGRGVLHICRPAPQGGCDRSGQPGCRCVCDSFADCPRPVCVCIKPRKVHPFIHEVVYSCAWSCSHTNQKQQQIRITDDPSMHTCKGPFSSWHAWTFFILIFACVRKTRYCSQNATPANFLYGLQSKSAIFAWMVIFVRFFCFYNIVKSHFHWARTTWK